MVQYFLHVWLDSSSYNMIRSCLRLLSILLRYFRDGSTDRDISKFDSKTVAVKCARFYGLKGRHYITPGQVYLKNMWAGRLYSYCKSVKSVHSQQLYLTDVGQGR